MTTVGKRPDRGAFIPAYLDDYPLKPTEFRVYARIMRRAGTHHGKHYESIPHVAEACRMNQKTVRQAFRVLEALGMIIVNEIPGRPSEIEPTHESEWKPANQVEKIREESTPTPTKNGTPTPTKNGTPTPTKRGSPPLPKEAGVPLPKEDHKGTPSKVLPEGTPSKDQDPGLNHSLSYPEREREIEVESLLEKPESPQPYFPDRQNVSVRQERQFFEKVPPPWRIGFGPNDWNEAALDGICGWMIATFGQGRTRADAIAYIAKREHPDHPDHAGMAARVDEVLKAANGPPRKRKTLRQLIHEEEAMKEANSA